jgi:hypothetical protein
MLQFTEQQMLDQKAKMEAVIRVTTSVDRKKIYEETLRKIELALQKKKQQTQHNLFTSPQQRTATNYTQQTQPKHTSAPTVVTFSSPTTHTDLASSSRSNNSHSLKTTTPTSVPTSSSRNPNTDTYTVSVADGARPRVKIIYPCSKEVLLSEGQLRNRITRAIRDIERSRYYNEGGELSNLKLYRSCKAFYEGLMLISPNRDFKNDNIIIQRIKNEITSNSTVSSIQIPN